MEKNTHLPTRNLRQGTATDSSYVPGATGSDTERPESDELRAELRASTQISTGPGRSAVRNTWASNNKKTTAKKNDEKCSKKCELIHDPKAQPPAMVGLPVLPRQWRTCPGFHSLAFDSTSPQSCRSCSMKICHKGLGSSELGITKWCHVQHTVFSIQKKKKIRYLESFTPVSSQNSSSKNAVRQYDGYPHPY